METSENKKIIRNLLLLAAAVAVISLVVTAFFRTQVIAAAFSKALNLLMPFIYGAVIAYLLNPVEKVIERYVAKLLDAKGTGKKSRLIRNLSVMLSLVLFFLIVVLLLLAVIPEVINSIAGIVQQMPQALESFTSWIETLDTGEVSHELVTGIDNAASTATENLENFLSQDLLPRLTSMLSGMTTSVKAMLMVLKNFGLGCIISIYLLAGRETFKKQALMILYAVFPKSAADWILGEVRLMDRMFGGFIIGKLVDSLIIGVICFIFMLIAKMPYAVLVSVIVGVTNIIPFFGPYIGAIPSALMILTASPISCLIFVVFIVILQQIDGNVIGPRILGDKLGLSSFWILFSILVFGSLWGVLGMIVGAPLFAVIYDLVRTLVHAGLRRRGAAAEDVGAEG